MKIILAISLFFMLCQGQKVFAQEKKIHLTFGSNGILHAAPPEEIVKDEISQFKIYIEKDAELINKRVLDGWDMYYHLAKTLIDINRTAFRIFNGIPEKSIILKDGKSLSVYWVILLQAYTQMNSINEKHKDIINEERKILLSALNKEIDSKIEDKKYKKINSFTTLTLVPEYESLIKTEYSFSITGFDNGNFPNNNTLTKKSELPGDQDAYKIDMTKCLTEIIEQNDIHYIDFELVVNNPIFSTIKKQINNYPIPIDKFIVLRRKENLLKAYEDFLHNKENQNLYKKALKLWEELQNKDENETNSILNTNSQLLGEIKTQLEKINKERNIIENQLGFSLESLYLDNFFYSFLWFTNGKVLSNPFIPTIEKIINRKKELNSAISSYQLEKELLYQKISFYEKISNSNLNLSKDQLELRYQKYDALLKEKLALDIKIKELQADLSNNEKQLANISQQNLSFKENNFQNESLYHGRFYLSDHPYIIDKRFFFKKIPIKIKSKEFNPGYVMRHHNALDNYDIITPNYKIEIREDQRMMVLVHNEQQDADIILKPTFLPIEDNLDYLGLALGIDGAKKESSSQELNDFITVYNQLKALQYGILTNPPSLIEDDTANYVTKLASHQAPLKSPLAVTYEIEKNGKKVKEGEYRINKLYQFRFKAGAIYSRLERKDYNTEVNPVTLDKERHGLDGTFGIQFFIIKQDIRSPKLGFRPFIYTGFSLSKSPIENWYLGGGFEPINGLALMGGVHLGEGEKLRVDNNQITTKDQLVTGPFVSIAFDLNVFNRIFNFDNISNPFKSNE